MRLIVVTLISLLTTATSVAADVIQGRLVSIDSDTRHVTLEGGEVMSISSSVVIDELIVGQLLRLEYQSGTANVNSVLVLEEPQPPLVDEEPLTVEE